MSDTSSPNPQNNPADPLENPTEQFQDLKQQLDGQAEQSKDLKQQLDTVENTVQGINTRVQDIDTRVQDIDTRVQRIKIQVENPVWKRIGIVVTAIVMGVVGGGIINWFLERGSEIDQKLARLETQVENIENQVDNKSGAINGDEDSEQGLSPIILKDGKLTRSYGMGVDSSFGDRDWLKPEGNNSLCMNYPGGSKNDDWGAVFITVGEPSPVKIGGNFSQYNQLSLELKSSQDNNSIYIGLRDENLPDNNPGDRYEIEDISEDWQFYSIELSEANFPDTDFNNLYTVASFVFEGQQQQTVCFRNIQYEPID